ncbi:MAG: CPBP family intramembrane metalloprotease [Phycisphaerales bacterium]|nr:CPBP family intramembrane metalloprotease [Planctomycetota bacterium]MCH8509810.1 CPBP family intramembrane metalloprotease [Phycisphaerales bacterium]
MSRRTHEPGLHPTRPAGPLQRGYFWLSARPLHILVFLTPVIIAAELGALGLGGDGIGAQLAAHRMLVRFFELFGVLGLHLPALALVIALIVQHVLSKDRWRIEPIVPAAMVVESAFLTGPLLILVLILQPGSPAAAALEGGPDFLSPKSGILLALGAGLYEEMLFRLVVITAMHFVAADLLRLPDTAAKVIAVLVSAVLFALHHDTTLPAMMGGGTDWRLFSFYFIAGVYFGVLFLARGLGIAVGVHACYDLLVLVIMPGFAGSE